MNARTCVEVTVIDGHMYIGFIIPHFGKIMWLVLTCEVCHLGLRQRKVNLNFPGTSPDHSCSMQQSPIQLGFLSGLGDAKPPFSLLFCIGHSG